MSVPPRSLSQILKLPDLAEGVVYTHTQGAASNEWTINHNLGYRPDIELYTVGGAKFIGEILHITDNQAKVYLASAKAGQAKCK